MAKFPMKVIFALKFCPYQRVQITLMVMILKYWNLPDNRYSLVKGIAFKCSSIVSLRLSITSVTCFISNHCNLLYCTYLHGWHKTLCYTLWVETNTFLHWFQLQATCVKNRFFNSDSACRRNNSRDKTKQKYIEC